MKLKLLSSSALVFLFSGLLLAADPPLPPTEPEDALATIQVREGYTIEQVAAEPLVKDPVAIAWSADGRPWVAEMADYPVGVDEDGTPGGRVRFLKDLDGDGKMDESVVFADKLNFPSGVLPWGDGVLVTSAPEILFLKDTDGDGVADSREVLFRGFAEDNQQLRVNGLRRGLDGWIYCASGSPSAGRKKSKVESVKTGEIHDLGSLDFRFKPDTGEFEIQSGPTQFGRNRDEWGNWFGCMNSYPLWHFVLEDAWLKRNPFLSPPDPRRQLVLPRNPKVYPAKAPQKRFHSFVHNGHYTSSCSGMIYRDELLFPREEGTSHAFSCEPFHNLVQHLVVEEDGFSFKAHRPESDGPVDFFASKDRWCRPVQARTGPDGALYVVDMYRYVIEHSQFLAETGMKELAPFLRAGDDRGRIYRIFPKGNPPRKVAPIDLSNSYEQLSSPNGVVRDLAQETLVQNNKVAEYEPGSVASPQMQIHALYLREEISPGKVADEVKVGLKGSHPEVRRNAIRIAENYDKLADDLSAMTDDTSPRVRLQLAASLGQFPKHEAAAQALGKLAVSDGGDPHFDATLLSSTAPENIEAIVAAIFSDDSKSDGASNLAGRLLALSVAFDKDEVTLAGLRKILNAGPNSSRYAMVAGLLDALDEHDSSIEKLLDGDTELAGKLNQFISKAKKVALNEKATLPARSTAIRLLGRSSDEAERKKDLQSLGAMLVPSEPAKFQSAVIAHLAALDDPAVADALLSGWKSHGPSVRSEILGVLSTRRPWVTRLLDAIESGIVSPGNVNPTVQLSIRRGADAAGRERFFALFSDENAGTQSRKEVVDQWKPALDLKGDRKRGAEVFAIACAACHKLDEVGNDVGPDLTSLSDKRPIALFTAILDPNAQLDARYTNYVATTNDGKSVIGFLAAETSNSLTLKGADGSEHDILRNNLKSLESTGISLMPEGLEALMDHQKLADLISYLEKAGLPSD